MVQTSGKSVRFRFKNQFYRANDDRPAANALLFLFPTVGDFAERLCRAVFFVVCHTVLFCQFDVLLFAKIYGDIFGNVLFEAKPILHRFHQSD